ncbi:MAG: SoxR reducing system RseC family protein [Bacteroidales bacterium]|nr:SoxR reducing system RseC family protein [Bacteroidales bacterium]
MIISETVKSGVVVRTEENNAWVKITCASDGCDGCRISSLCSQPSYTPTLHATIAHGLKIKAGDKVIVTGRVKNWLKGWVLMAGLPMAAILVGLIFGSLLELKDGLTGTIALGFVIVYYLLLWIFRKRIDRNVEWVVESLKTD